MRLHVLPKEGGVLDQEEKHIERLMRVFNEIDEWEKEEIERQKKSSGT